MSGAWRRRLVLRPGGNDKDLGVQLGMVNPQPRPQRRRRQQVERVLRRAAHVGGNRHGAIQDLRQRQPGRYCIGGILPCWQRLRLTGPRDERLSQQQSRVAAPPGPGLSRRRQPGHRDGELAQYPRALRQTGCQRASACSCRPGPVALTAAGFPSSCHASGCPPGTGTDIGASRTSAACAPASRLGTRAETADCGSVPSSTASCPGASNAAHANFEGGRTEPISTATTRVPIATDQTACHPRPAS